MRTEASAVLSAPSALSLLLLLILLNLVLQPLTEPDFGWHLRTGLDLLDTGGLPSLDPYSHTMPDWPWVEHAWLADGIVGVLYRHTGGLPVIFFFGAVTACAWLLAANLADCTWHSRLLACCLSLWVALPYLGARTQLLSLLGLSCLLTFLWRTSISVQMIGIPLLFLGWANLHGGFTAGLFLLGLFIPAAAIVKWLVARGILEEASFRPDPSLRLPLAPLALAAVAGLGLTFLNPYGWRLYAEIIESLSDRFMLDRVQEWQPPSLETLAGRNYLLYLSGLAAAAVLWYRRIEPVRWAVWTAFLLLSLRHMRNIPLFLIVSVPLCAELLAAAGERLRAWVGWGGAGVVRSRQAMTLAVGLLVLWLGPEHLVHVLMSGREPARYFQQTSYPIEAIQWIGAHRERLGKRMFNEYGHGGFILWWLPGEKIFIDGRMPAWHIDERRIFEDYLALTSSDPDLSILNKYGVDWMLVKRNSPLDRAMALLPEWPKEYEDKKVTIYRSTVSDRDG